MQSWWAQAHRAEVSERGGVTGEEAFWKFSAVLMDEQATFFDVNTYELTRRQIYDKYASCSLQGGRP